MCLYVCVFGQHRLAQLLTDRALSGTNRFKILPEVFQTKTKHFEKVVRLSRDLVIADKLTDRVVGTNQFRIS